MTAGKYTDFPRCGWV